MGATGVTTATQEAMWLEQVFAPAEPNNVVTLWDVDGDLDVPLFTSALQVAVAEADALWVNFRRSHDGLRLVAREPGGVGALRPRRERRRRPGGRARATVASMLCERFGLERVLDVAMSILAPGGRIVVGDVRNHRTLRAFTEVVYSAKRPENRAAAVQAAIERAVLDKKELVIDPAFFVQWAEARPDIAATDVRLKQGAAHNELTRHRYEVVLHKLDRAALPDPDPSGGLCRAPRTSLEKALAGPQDRPHPGVRLRRDHSAAVVRRGDDQRLRGPEAAGIGLLADVMGSGGIR